MKGINRSMVCREVASLAKGVKRGGIYDGHDDKSVSMAGTIRCKYCTITNTYDNTVTVLIFDTEQECINALRTLTEALLDNQYPILTMTDDNECTSIICQQYIFYQPPSQEESDTPLDGTDIPTSSTSRIAIFYNHADVDLALHCDVIVLDRLSYNVNNPTNPIVMTKDYVSTNYPSAKLNDFTIRFI